MSCTIISFLYYRSNTLLKKEKQVSKRKTRILTFLETTIKTLIYVLPTSLLCRHAPLYSFHFCFTKCGLRVHILNIALKIY